MTGVNWPDLRRDYDSMSGYLPKWSLAVSELTWFEKGLRLRKLLPFVSSSLEWIDLIWEGITTRIDILPFFNPFHRVNWPDLRRDYDSRFLKYWAIFLFIPEWIDLIWEGITTMKLIFPSFPFLPRSELTWFEKGLRPHYSFCSCFNWPWVNWPDLRRDYDTRPIGSQVVYRMPYEWIDLIWEGITTLLLRCHPAGVILSELTWFEKGLRLLLQCLLPFPRHVSELTWFEKGLRLNFLDPIQGQISRVNWPDLRRDYDLICFVSHPVTST